MTGQNLTNALRRTPKRQPIGVDPETGKDRILQRPTTFIAELDSTAGLTNWKLRELAKELSSSPNYARAIQAAGDDNKKMSAIIRGALEAARLSLKADRGSYIHYVLECDDREGII